MFIGGVREPISIAHSYAGLEAQGIPVLQLLKGQAVNPAPLVMNTCYSFVTPGEAMHVASVHRYDAAEQTMKAVPGAGGLSPAASAEEGRFALAWADNIWADTLAL